MTSFFTSTVLAAVPVAIAGIGGLFSQRAGVLNIALEGIILAGAFAAILVGSLTGSVALALCAGMGAGLLLSTLQILLTLQLQANIFITGLGINLLAAGSIPLFSQLMLNTAGVYRLPATMRLAAGLPVLLLGAWTIGAWLLFGCTRTGIELHAAGSEPELLQRRGRPVHRYRALALILSGLAAGLAGSLLSLRVQAYAPGMSAGRGWIALGTVFLGFLHPVGVVIGALVYGLADAAAGGLQRTAALPSGILIALPYLVTTAAFIFSAAVKLRQSRE
ncbi:ABC transporter permease [Spirochaeta africana]|uniref:Putative ABC-type transport system, permease component n=1 Tax=Spirochaeta africana (strain ATCC 700263 / DSM 8902 / Z-7692) TaxID=889378 RepID=H9UKL6_SPIAZ|nr:ABC transporter permease [Spirochaeta africana]AFG38059.1 putative ABC-type transport system, permease component [Spirochaeta africana DSM 8902]